MSRVRDRDKGYKALKGRIQDFKKGTIKIGILEADGAKAYEDAMTVLQVAIFNEFGTENIPARSFLRAWFDENLSRCREAVKRLGEAVVQGKYTAQQAQELLAQRFVAEIQKRISTGIAPANAAATVARKGSSKPLIDTGQLRASITYRIEN